MRHYEVPSFWLELDRDLMRGGVQRPFSRVSSILARNGTAVRAQSSSSSRSSGGSWGCDCMLAGGFASELRQHSWSVEEEE